METKFVLKTEENTYKITEYEPILSQRLYEFIKFIDSKFIGCIVSIGCNEYYDIWLHHNNKCLSYMVYYSTFTIERMKDITEGVTNSIICMYPQAKECLQSLKGV